MAYDPAFDMVRAAFDKMAIDQRIEALADKHAAILKDWLTEAQWREVRAENADNLHKKLDHCASHNFCDANMAMLEAFKEITGRDMLEEDQGWDEDRDFGMINAAWALAIRKHMSDPAPSPSAQA